MFMAYDTAVGSVLPTAVDAVPYVVAGQKPHGTADDGTGDRTGNGTCRPHGNADRRAFHGTGNSTNNTAGESSNQFHNYFLLEICCVCLSAAGGRQQKFGS